MLAPHLVLPLILLPSFSFAIPHGIASAGVMFHSILIVGFLMIFSWFLSGSSASSPFGFAAKSLAILQFCYISWRCSRRLYFSQHTHCVLARLAIFFACDCFPQSHGWKLCFEPCEQILVPCTQACARTVIDFSVCRAVCAWARLCDLCVSFLNCCWKPIVIITSLN